ncbi:MAG: hypothetical protein ACOCUI_03640 [bacterium]
MGGYGGLVQKQRDGDKVYAGGGAGFYGDGKDYRIGKAFINGGIGGNGFHQAGFGGGSGAGNGGSGGGGGGYSGGGAGGWSNYPSYRRYGSGGGGGSYIDSSATNIATSDGKYNNSTTFNSETIENLNSYNTGHGKVTIEYLGE